MLSANSVSGLTLTANGGDGGSQLITNTENEGPGGGGGGGIIAISSGAPFASAQGGLNGITTSSSLTEFIPNGATQGGVGTPNASLPSLSSLPFCLKPGTEMTGSKSVAPFPATAFMLPGNDVSYSFSLTSTGIDPVDAGSIELIDQLPSEIEFWFGEYDPMSAPVSGPVEFEAGSSGLTCCTGANEVDYSNSTGPLPVWGYNPVPGYDPNVRYIRVRPSGAMNAGTTATLRFRARIK